MNTSTTTLNLKSARARKARLAVLLDTKAVRVLLWTVLLSSIFFWIYGVFIDEIAAAHLLLALLPVSTMPLAWYAGELKTLAPTASIGSAVDMSQVIEKNVLGKLHSPLDIEKLITVVMNQPGGRFFASRFAINAEVLLQMIDPSKQADDLEDVFSKAIELSNYIQHEQEISASQLVAAIILSSPQHEAVLARMKLSPEDIITGMQWESHITFVIARSQVKQFNGGIGRDLSFGWTPLLSRLGNNISEGIGNGHILHREIEGHEEAIKQTMHLLSQPGRRNATLVGEVGVGKTTLVYALAQKLITANSVPAELRYRQIIELNASTLISQTKARGELESLLTRVVNEAIHAKNVVLFLDEAQLFLKDGTGSVDLSNILLQILEGGALQVIVALDNQEWLRLGQSNPSLAQLMNRVVVNPLERSDTLRVMEDQILLLESRNKVVYMFDSLNEAYSMAERFIRDQAFPGKAIRLLESAAGFAEQTHFITAQSVQKAVESSFGVKVQTASTQTDKDTLLNLEEKIHERMINQTHAVQVVSDALRRARAGVRNNDKPIGTFLFLGPTGVGKTELSKALADVYFGGADKIVRVDLNEYSQADDVSRLLEIGAENTNSLTAQIAKQPFSVVLLDEIEKAHPNVLNVLLQLLDEGMLRDSQNKPVSFRDAIIIATSNAGADKIREHIAAGEQIEQFEEEFIDRLINSNVFRPEFLNRFDETVLFRPLSVDELVQVVDLLMIGINKTLAKQKVSVSLTQDAKAYLAKTGYDPRLGARPLRRIVQRSIENIVAQKILSGSVQAGATIELDTPELTASLENRR